MLFYGDSVMRRTVAARSPPAARRAALRPGAPGGGRARRAPSAPRLRASRSCSPRCPDLSQVVRRRGVAGGGARCEVPVHRGRRADRGRQDLGGGAPRERCDAQHRPRGVGVRTRSSSRSTTAPPAPPSRPSCSSSSRATASSRSCVQRRLFEQATLCRLRLREEQAVRVPQPRRQRAAHLRQALRAARGGPAAARPRGLPAGADRGADAAHPPRGAARGGAASPRSTWRR